jgi:hypothetical protein
MLFQRKMPSAIIGTVQNIVKQPFILCDGRLFFVKAVIYFDKAQKSADIR